MLHLSSTYLTAPFSDAGLPGKAITWSDPLHVGAAPSEVGDAAWRALRAQALADIFGEEDFGPEASCAFLLKQDEALDQWRGHEEVVIWLGAGLADQLHLIRHLDWFANRHLGQTRLSLARVGDLGGNLVTSVGACDWEDVPSLYQQRHGVTPAEFRLAQAA